MVDRRPDEDDRTASAELRRTRIALVLITLALLPIGHRVFAWPIVTWPMYSQNATPFPLPTESFVELRVVDAAGTSHRVVSSRIFPMGRSGVARAAIVLAFDDDDPEQRDAHRRYLASVVERIPGIADPVEVQGWRLEWDVNPLAVPPLRHDKPRQSVLLGTFDVSRYRAGGGRGR